LYLKRWIWMLRNNLPKLAKLAARDAGQTSELQRSQTILRWLRYTCGSARLRRMGEGESRAHQ
jgi:hypothetical protein